MFKQLGFFSQLIGAIFVISLLNLAVASPSHANGFVTTNKTSPVTTAASLINNINLPTPSWWSGNCDVNNNPGSTPLGSSYRGMPTCGPFPNVHPDHTVYFPKGDMVQVNEWECTELAMRYLYLAYGQSPYVASGGQVVSNYPGTLLQQISNNAGSGNAPQVGDIISSNTTDPAGHVVIVQSANVDTNGNGTITVIDENGISGAGGIETYHDTNWLVDSGVTGWLHPNTLVASQNPGTVTNSLSAVSADAANDVWAVGSFQNTSGYHSPLIEHWNGSNWVYTPSPDSWVGDHYLTGVKAFSPNNVWAVGYYYDTSGNGQTIIEHSTNGGKTWTPTTQGPGFLYAIDGASATDIWAVGTTPNEIGLTLHFTNNVWTSVSNNTTSGTILKGVSARTTKDVWAVGNGPFSKTFTMHWELNGSSYAWVTKSSPNPGNNENILFGVTDVAVNNAWAVGRSDSTPNEAGFLIHWNGSTWSTPTILPGSTGSSLFAISALSSQNIWAVGYNSNGSTNAALIEHTSNGGKTWQQITTVNPQRYNDFEGIVVYKQNGNVWSVGEQNGTTPQTLIEFFN